MNFDSELKTRITAVLTPKVASSAVDCLVAIYAPLQSQLGQRYLLDRPQITIGRGLDNDIVLPSDSVSRQHLRIERRDNALYAVDLASTNGSYVNDSLSPVKEHRLMRGDLIKVGDNILKYLSGSDVEAQYHEIIFSMTITDGLTNLSNRKQLDALLAEEITRSQRHSRPLSLLMLDVDHFKKINDSYGHLAGDMVLRSLAGLLQRRMRPTDKLGRYGGEEFCAILAETNLQNATAIANELRELIANHPFVADKHEFKATVSIGASTLLPGMKGDDLYARADEMLYQAKRSGRNCVMAS
jgi:two-component system, cell cycle response regulator